MQGVKDYPIHRIVREDGPGGGTWCGEEPFNDDYWTGSWIITTCQACRDAATAHEIRRLSPSAEKTTL
jgi:hypothetical protein